MANATNYFTKSIFAAFNVGKLREDEVERERWKKFHNWLTIALYTNFVDFHAVMLIEISL